MSNTRQPQHPVDASFPGRWSPRAFTGQALCREQLSALFEAVRWAPSAMNVQPWRFCYALKGTPLFERFVDLLAEGNQVWAKHAGALVALLSTTTYVGSDGSEKPFASHAFDAGAAWMSLALQARSMGLVTHAMGGFDNVRARDYLRVPDNLAINAFIAIGYQGDAEQLPEALQAREKASDRHPQEQWTFEGPLG
ncbi:nitroreductase family protein [Pseudomonas sp. RL]|uniref:nitroreductase family protein n=1 Tax=Pseudomonas sp. RL TaxID=1452718 RepID=UPI000484811E|nr:nitroreductase family protein [Pseudomonas sp. RL]